MKLAAFSGMIQAQEGAGLPAYAGTPGAPGNAGIVFLAANGNPSEAGDACSGAFTIAPPAIFGPVRTINGWSIAGLTVRTADGSAAVQTDSFGAYSLAVAPARSGTVTPVSAGWAWSPASRIYVNLTTGATHEDFSVTPAEAFALITTRSTNTPQFGWPSPVGLQYQLQSATNPPATNWLNEGLPLGTDGMLLTNLPLGSEPA